MNEAIEHKVENKKDKAKRKLRKLQRDPKAFVKDSKAYIHTYQTLVLTWAKFGSFAIVLAASLMVVIYYGLIASPRYVSESQFVVKQSSSNELPIPGLAALGSVSPSVRDSLILKAYIESRAMALALDKSMSLKAHYQRSEWDGVSRLTANASVEDYVKYYLKHVKVQHDELSDIIKVEVQAFEPEFAQKVSESLLKNSEQFINGLGSKMVSEQIGYAEKEVQRAYAALKTNQKNLVNFQDENQLYSPEQRGNSLMAAIQGLESEITGQQAELKSLVAFMRNNAPEVKAKKIRIKALKDQLAEEKARLTNQDQKSINKINADFQEIKLNTELASSLYTSSLASLETIRSEAYRKLKHLLVIEQPAIAQDSQYPRRLYTIVTWFAVLLLMYAIIRLIVTIIREHKD